MRTTMHGSRTDSRGRVHGSKHNDRNFDTAKAQNIDSSRSAENQYWHCYKGVAPELTFEEAELRFYEENFGKRLEQINAKHLANRHPERCKTMEEWKRVRQYAPEEITIQIGKTEEHASKQQLVECFNEFWKRVLEWNKEHGMPFRTLSRALHMDEAVPHIQIRRVWVYQDGEELRLGQEKALKAAGLELPDPSRPESRRNNRKMVFDRWARELWLDICREKGLDLERDPLPNGRHNKDKEDMIREKYEDMIERTRAAEVQEKQLLEKNSQLQIDNKIMTAKEASWIMEEARPVLLEKDMVKISKKDLRSLAKAAAREAEAREQAQKAAAVLPEAERQAKILLQRADKEATERIREADKTAEERSMVAYLERMKLESELEHYNNLRDLFPEVFEKMERISRQQDRDLDRDSER